jgi:hypothetical protein
MIHTVQSFTDLESTPHSLFTRLGKLYAILFKDCREKLAEEAENTEEETCTIFSKNRQRLTQKSCRTEEV